MAKTIDQSTLQQDAIKSAELYLNYLIQNRNNGKGMFSAQVRSIQGTLLNDTDLVLYTDRKVRNADGLMIRVEGTIYENSSSHTYFLVKSVEGRKVVIVPSSEFAERINSAQAAGEKVFVEVDLTFLVRRVKDWYEKHGKEVKIPTAKPQCALDSKNPIKLSENQLGCVNKALSSPLSYIWGAPGTGKTKHVLAACVYSYIKANKKILLLAPTNTALEQSLKGLLRALSAIGFNPDGKVLRIGVPSDDFQRSWPNLCGQGAYNYIKAEIDKQLGQLKYENSLIETSLEIRQGKAEVGAVDRYPKLDLPALEAKKKENIVKINNLLKYSRKMSEGKSVMPLITRFNVLAATVDSCIHWISPDGAFKPDHVFLDEAGYCSVIKGLTLTAFNCPLTMLGDHMQLPPVFDCDDNKLMTHPDSRIVKLWQISTLYNEDVLFSNNRSSLCVGELVRQPCFNHTTTGALTETYRFGPDLANALAGIYRNNFRSKSSNETQILFVNVPKLEQDKGKDASGKYKRISHSESKCIRDMIEHNLSRLDCTLGIITPYKNQWNQTEGYIRRLMKKYEIDNDMDEDVLTVHRSQGREWDVVLFSITDSYDEKWSTNSGRLAALKLINTAVSRAKKLLVLIGDMDSWKQHNEQLITNLLKVAHECGTDIYFRDYCSSIDPYTF